MKTTVEISDELLREAKRVAQRDGVTLRAVLEAALRRELARRLDREPFRLRDGSFDGRGFQRDVAGASWDTLRDVAYEGRGT